LTNSCNQPHQSYTITSSPPQLLAHRQTQPQPLTPYRQQTQWLHHCFTYMVQYLLCIYDLQENKYSRLMSSYWLRFSLVSFN